MCRTNPVTKDHIELMKVTLQKRMDNPHLTAEQRAILQSQYEYVVANIKEHPGSVLDPEPSANAK